jgi:hypothetical protein
MTKPANIIFQVIIAFFIATMYGCDNISEFYFRVGMNKKQDNYINLANGVDAKEAIIMAQRTLLNSKYNNAYYVSRPLLGNDEKYNLWGISFKPKKSGYDKCGYAVMINKTSGRIEEGCFSGL